MMRRALVISLLGITALVVGIRPSLRGQETIPKTQGAQGAQVPTEKQTRLGLYLTAKEAYEKWQADPEHIKILDVRTPEEYVFVGHAEKAWNVPLMFMLYQWDAAKKRPAMRRNEDFVARVKERYHAEDTILVTCRSGQRSKAACDLLAEAGFKQVYNIVDGMEGDAVTDPKHPDAGKRTLNGWKNSHLPWTYDVDPELMYSTPAK